MPNSKQNFLDGVNLDADELRLPTTPERSASQYIYNMTYNVQQNPQSPGGAGANEGVYTPLEGNNVLPLTTPLPAGGMCVGYYNSEQTNEGYYFVYDPAGNHQIRVISGDTGNERVVYQGNLLPFVPNPQNFVSEGRCTMLLRSYTDPVTGLQTNFKFLIFTVNLGIQYCIGVEDSIATGFFNGTLYPRFAGAGTIYDPILLIHLGVNVPVVPLSTGTPPAKPITITEVPYDPVADAYTQNLLARVAWQFRVKFVDVYGRESEHGIMSDVYISVVGGGCIGESNQLPQILTLNFDGGSPLVEYIQIEYRRSIGNDPAGLTWSDWMIYETINKYVYPSPSTPVPWYSKVVNTAYIPTASNNVVVYQFNATKGNQLIPTAETDRTQPGIPITSGGAAMVGTQLDLYNNVVGFEPLTQDMIANVQFAPYVPPGPTCNPAGLVQVIVYAFIFRPRTAKWNYASRSPISPYQAGWGLGEPSAGALTVCSGGSRDTMAQWFADFDNPGFIGYMAGQSGAEYAVVSEQGWLDPCTRAWQHIGYDINSFVGGFLDWPSYEPVVLAQRFVFNIKPGKYIFRIASHHAKITDAGFRNTSTYVAGRVTMDQVRNTFNNLDPALGMMNYAADPIKELELDCSTGAAFYDFGCASCSFLPVSKALVILDLSDVGGNALDGYYYEEPNSIPIEMNTVYWGANTGVGTFGDCFGSFYTDHNGYYFGAGTEQLSVYLYSNFCDTSPIPLKFSKHNTGAAYGSLIHGDGNGGHLADATPSQFGSACQNVVGYWYNKVYATGPGTPSGLITFPDAARRYVYINVGLCGSSDPVPGIPFIATKGASAITDALGNCTLILHNRYKYAPSLPQSAVPYTFGVPIANYDTAPNNSDLVVVSQRSSCNWSVCGSCSTYSIPDYNIAYLACGITPRSTTLPNLTLNIYGINTKGVQTGGVYPTCFWLIDEIGRHSYAQVLQGDAGYVTIYNMNAAGYQRFALYGIQVTVSAAFQAPSWAKRIAFGIAPNTAFTDFATWAADWVQFVDSSGFDNTIEPASVRIYYASMNEYAKNYNYAVNNTWQFLTTETTSGGSTGTPQIGDVIQFIMNGDGSWLGQSISYPVVFVKAGSYFTIAYDSHLQGLTNGCLYRIIRPNTTQNANVFFEQCLVLDLNSSGQVDPSIQGVPQVLNYYDSYLLNRSIPVPILGAVVTQTVSTVTANTGPTFSFGSAPPIPAQFQYVPHYSLQQIIGTQPYAFVKPGATPILPLAYSDSQTSSQAVNYVDNNPNTNHVVVQTGMDIMTNFPFLFESPSPSDFWGSHLANRGRVMIPNPYEARARYPSQMALSDEITNQGLLNNMSYFEDGNVVTFPYNTWGDIVAVVVEVNQVLVICLKNHFVTYFNSTQLQTDANGNVVSNNSLGIFQQPQKKSGMDYGCTYYDINTIRRHRGIVRWLSDTGVIVKSMFGDSEAEANTGFIGWLKQAVAQVKQLNLAHAGIYWTAGIDPKTQEYFLTCRSLSGPYVNSNARYADQIIDTPNRTLIIGLMDGKLRGFAPFTPECYGMIPAYYQQTQFLSFIGGQPYLHHNSTTLVPFGYFYGQQFPCSVTVTVNQNSAYPKRYMACEVYVAQKVVTGATTPSQVLFFVPSGYITTESGQTSYIPVGSPSTATTWAQFWNIADNFQSAAFLCDLGTFPDPNQPIPSTAIDGNPLWGRWMKATFVTQPAWDGSYFELSEINVIYDQEPKAAE